MTEPLFFDTDCISAFLWVDEENILTEMLPERIVVPKPVYDELSHPGLNRIKALKTQLDTLIAAGQAKIETIMTDTKEHELYEKLILEPDCGHTYIGKGEAAAIALAKEKGGILASNNLKDVADYVREFGLLHITTGGIMKAALEKGILTEQQGNIIWKNMLAKRRKLGYASFSDFLQEDTIPTPAI